MLRIRRKDGEIISVDARNATIRDADGNFQWLIGVSTDATERVRRETELRSARDFQRALAESIPEGVLALDETGCVTYVNAEAERLLGWKSNELVGRRVDELAHPAAGDGTALGERRSPLAGRDAGVVEVTDDVFVRGDGTYLPVAYKASSFETVDGVHGTVVVFRDITAEKAEQDQQRERLLALSWAGRVRDALEHGSFELYAQPIVDIASGVAEHHELLLRMRVDGEVLLPGEFLPAAETHGLIAQVDRWVVAEACRLALSSPVAVNLSAESLANPTLVGEIALMIGAAGAKPENILFEITETGVISNEALARQLLERLAELGCGIALDDFGTGYGGFTYLKRLPVHYLKIDKEFVADIATNDENRAVVEAIVRLGRAFGQKTIAEGVENEWTLQVLSDLGVDYAQGYLFGRPSAATEMLANERSYCHAGARSSRAIAS